MAALLVACRVYQGVLYLCEARVVKLHGNAVKSTLERVELAEEEVVIIPSFSTTAVERSTHERRT